jgi:ribosomal protein L32
MFLFPFSFATSDVDGGITTMSSGIVRVKSAEYLIYRCTQCYLIGAPESFCPVCNRTVDTTNQSSHVYECETCGKIRTAHRICCEKAKCVPYKIEDYLCSIMGKNLRNGPQRDATQKDENIASICKKMFNKAKQKISELETYTKEPFLLCPQSDLLLKEMTDFANSLPACTEKSKISEKIKILLELAEKARTMEQLLSIFPVEKMVQFADRGNMDHDLHLLSSQDILDT